MQNFEKMNETDVREVVVRPLLEQLGYRHGTEANIRTEVTLKYAHHFLGRKNPKKDPVITGRADYICEVISFGRWVVEVKAPSEALDRNAIEQAHTYAAHPEIAASHFLITNGRRFQVFQTGHLDAALMEWSFEQTQENFLSLYNLLGPDAVRRRVNLVVADPGKPLGRGVASRVEIIGGEVAYDNHHSDNPIFATESINGLRLPITGGLVERLEDGKIHAHVDVARAAALFRELNDLMGAADGYDFYSPAEFISTDANEPSIFQNFITTSVPAGSLVAFPPFGKIPMPFSFAMSAVTEAVGFVDGDIFKGTMNLSYDCELGNIAPQVRALLEQRFGQRIPDRSQFEGGGTFEVKLKDAI